MPDITGSGGVQGKKASLSGSGAVHSSGSGGVQVKKPAIQAHSSFTVTGSGGVQVKKPALHGSQGLKGSGGVRVKKPALHGSQGLKGSGGVQVKKPALQGVIAITGSGGVQAKKAALHGSVTITGSGGVQARKPSLAGRGRALIIARVGGQWAEARVFARINGVWVGAVPKVWINGQWVTVTLGGHGQFLAHGGVQVKKPALQAIGLGSVTGSGIIAVKKPALHGTQHIVTTGSGGVQAKKAKLAGIGKPPANAMLMGVNNWNDTTWDDYVSVIPNVSITRVYNQGSDGPNGIPTSWPHAAFTVRPAMKHLVVSIRPTDLNGFINGNYDAQTKTWLRLIPAGHYICMYHEANLAANIFQTTLHGTAAQFVAMHHKLRDLARAVEGESPSNPKLNVGIIIGSANVGVDNTPWIPDGMDWYGMDGYGGSKSVLPVDRFTPNINAILSVQPGANLAIIENNDKTASTPDRWNLWFSDAFALAQQYNMIIFMTWWGDTAQYPNAEPFNPAGTYVPTLQTIYSTV